MRGGKQKPPPIGTRYGMVEIVELCVARSIHRRFIMDRIRCDCGVEKAVLRMNLVKGSVQSCGCQFKSRQRHGHASGKGKTRHTPEYRAWCGMKNRCFNENYKEFHLYGGRGITVCERWLRFENFLEDMGPRPAGKSLDRVDGNGHYEPGNVRWATPMEQAINRRVTILVTLDGITKPLGHWADEFGLNRFTVYSRYEIHRDARKALELDRRTP